MQFFLNGLLAVQQRCVQWGISYKPRAVTRGYKRIRANALYHVS